MRELTPRQRQILEMIQEFIAKPVCHQRVLKSPVNSASSRPTLLKSICGRCRRKGVLDLLPGASRGIQLKDSLREQMGLPLVGRVAAGSPILAEEHIETHYKDRSGIFLTPNRITCCACMA